MFLWENGETQHTTRRCRSAIVAAQHHIHNIYLFPITVLVKISLLFLLPSQTYSHTEWENLWKNQNCQLSKFDSINRHADPTYTHTRTHTHTHTHTTKMLHKIQLLCILRVIIALRLLKIRQIQGSLTPGPHQGPLPLDPTGCLLQPRPWPLPFTSFRILKKTAVPPMLYHDCAVWGDIFRAWVSLMCWKTQ